MFVYQLSKWILFKVLTHKTHLLHIDINNLKTSKVFLSLTLSYRFSSRTNLKETLDCNMSYQPREHGNGCNKSPNKSKTISRNQCERTGACGRQIWPGTQQYFDWLESCTFSYIPQPVPRLSFSASEGICPSLSESALQRFRNRPKVASASAILQRSHSSYRDTTTGLHEERKRWHSLRKWQLAKEGRKTQKKCGVTFTVMSYNVLAQDLVSEHIYLYKHHITEALSWDVRWRNIFYEIKFHHCDIICFQEVQQSHLKKYYNKELTKLGYSYLYKQRTGGVKSDGCAIYFKHDVFNLLEHHTIEYNQGNVRNLDRDNVGIIAKFEAKDYPGNEFIVATTHLLYNPHREDIRIAQTQVLLSEIDRLSFKKGSKGEHVPVIVTGDFNTQPDSACYNLLNRGWLQLDERWQFDAQTGKIIVPRCLGITDNCQHVALIEERKNKDLSREDEMKLIALQHSERADNKTALPASNKTLFGTGTLRHNLNLKSVFRHRNESGSEATTYQNRWITVDYIFYSATRNGSNALVDDKLKLLARFTLPVAEYLGKVKIPNMVLGSDHFSVLAKFKLECNPQLK